MGWHAVDDLWAVFFGAVWCFWTTERKTGMEGDCCLPSVLPACAFQTDLRVCAEACVSSSPFDTVTPSMHVLLLRLHWGPSLQTISLQSTKPLCVFWWCVVVHCRVPVLVRPLLVGIYSSIFNCKQQYINNNKWLDLLGRLHLGPSPGPGSQYGGGPNKGLRRALQCMLLLLSSPSTSPASDDAIRNVFPSMF